jgi:putative flippase GtrA
MTLSRLRDLIYRHKDQLWKFAVAGGLGAVIDFSFLNMGVVFLHLDPRVSNIFSTLISSVAVFLINKFFAFRHRQGRAATQAVRFTVVYALAYVLNVGFTALFITIALRIFPTVAAPIISNGSKALAIGFVMFWNYALLHSFVFKKHGVEETPVVV